MGQIWVKYGKLFWFSSFSAAVHYGLVQLIPAHFGSDLMIRDDFQWTSPLINIDFHFMQLDLAWFILDFINLIFLVFSGHLKGRSYCERAMCVTKITPGLSKWNWNISFSLDINLACHRLLLLVFHKLFIGHQFGSAWLDLLWIGIVCYGLV